MDSIQPKPESEWLTQSGRIGVIGERLEANMVDPFKLFGRLLLAVLRTVAFTMVFLCQVAWFLIYRRPDKIGDAMGWYGREVVDSFFAVIRR